MVLFCGSLKRIWGSSGPRGTGRGWPRAFRSLKGISHIKNVSNISVNELFGPLVCDSVRREQPAPKNNSYAYAIFNIAKQRLHHREEARGWTHGHPGRKGNVAG